MAGKKETDRDDSLVEPVTTYETRPFTWADPGTWPASVKFLPAYIALLGIFISVYYSRYTETGIDLSSYEGCVGSFNYTFRINAALTQSHKWSTHSWDIGYAFEASQQVYNPERSVFGPKPFPFGRLPDLGLKLDQASLYVQPHINVSGNTLFYEENAATSDPAALGVAALMLSQRWGSRNMMAAATRQKDTLLIKAPRTSEGAISHRYERQELWSDAVAMVPPFLAYYGVATDDLEIIREAVRQIGLYRDALITHSPPKQGLWKHIVGSTENNDEGAWSTGNSWAAYGMARTRSTIASWSKARSALEQEMNDLDSWIKEIIDAAIRNDNDSSGLLRNYLGDSNWSGETSGTSLLAATVYRMAVLRKDVFSQPKYLEWAHQKRKEVFKRVDGSGVVGPAVNPLDPQAKEPVEISPEGQSFLILLGTAWRDCVCSSPNGICLAEYLEVSQAKIAGELGFETITGFTLESLLEKFKAQIQRTLDYFKAP